MKDLVAFSGPPDHIATVPPRIDVRMKLAAGAFDVGMRSKE
jgi:hypothetical protein